MGFESEHSWGLHPARPFDTWNIIDLTSIVGHYDWRPKVSYGNEQTEWRRRQTLKSAFVKWFFNDFRAQESMRAMFFVPAGFPTGTVVAFAYYQTPGWVAPDSDSGPQGEEGDDRFHRMQRAIIGHGIYTGYLSYVSSKNKKNSAYLTWATVDLVALIKGQPRLRKEIQAAKLQDKQHAYGANDLDPETAECIMPGPGKELEWEIYEPCEIYEAKPWIKPQLRARLGHFDMPIVRDSGDVFS
ncbi:MAG: hypothetical protein M1831_006510 [Alyxoria varia]|nr:MAG: hypothetical protein M1831_006510 [Alyxoria varia]